VRILLAVHHCPPTYVGGAEWRAHRTAKALLERGHDVRVVCVERIDRAPSGCAIGWTDDVYLGVPIRRLEFDLVHAADRSTWEYNNPWVTEHLAALMTSWRPAVFHLFSGYLIGGGAILAARELGIPTVLTATDYWFVCPRITLLRSDGSLSGMPISAARCARCLGEERRPLRWLGRLWPQAMDFYWRRRGVEIARVESRQAFLRAAMASVDTTIAPSAFLAQVLQSAQVVPSRLIVLRQGYAGDVSRPSARRRETGLRLGYLGQIAPHKGVHVLLRALKRLPLAPITLTVYGDMSAWPRYARRLRRLAGSDGRIVFAGAFPRHRVREVMDAFDVVVVPSLWFENSPNSIVEAFANGVPVIATRLGGMAELVEHGVSGLLFERGNERDLARQVKTLLDEPGLLESLRRGIPVTKTFEQEVDELELVYRDLAGRAGARL
jgi:glycosyltransferase involved in cell wall biosynthesis